MTPRNFDPIDETMMTEEERRRAFSPLGTWVVVILLLGAAALALFA